jgi:hypothetical protein
MARNTFTPALPALKLLLTAMGIVALVCAVHTLYSGQQSRSPHIAHRTQLSKVPLPSTRPQPSVCKSAATHVPEKSVTHVWASDSGSVRDAPSTSDDGACVIYDANNIAAVDESTDEST